MRDTLFTIPVLVVSLLFLRFTVAKYSRRERSYLWISWLAHQAAALAMIVVTQDYYGGGDMVGYHRFGSFFADRLRDDFFGFAPTVLNLILQNAEGVAIPGAMAGSNTGSMMGLSIVVMFLVNDSLYAACAGIATGSFYAKLAIYDVFRRELPAVPESTLLVTCLLIPSAVFWSAGLLKEPLAMIGLAMLIHAAHTLGTGRRAIAPLVYGAAGAVIAGVLKSYLLPPFGLAAFTWYLVRTAQRRGLSAMVIRGRYLAGGAILALLVVLGTGTAMPGFSPEQFAEEAMNAQGIGERIQGGSYYSLGAPASGSFSGQIALAPAAVATALFRPAVFEVKNVMMLLSSLEMLWLTIAMLVAFTRHRLVTLLRLVASTPALTFCAVFVLTLSVGVGLTTTNLGSLSRYRMPMMPFYATWLLVVAYRALPTARRYEPLGIRPGDRVL